MREFFCAAAALAAAVAIAVAITPPASEAQDAESSSSAPAIGGPVAPVSAPAGKRLVSISDIYRERDAGEPRVSPDGQWVAYSVGATDSGQDEQVSALYLASWDGRAPRRITWTKEGEYRPRWSPDGQWLGFLSSRSGEHEMNQVWVLPRDGGEAHRITTLPGGVSDFAWSPDGRRLAVIAHDADPDSASGEALAGKGKTPKPIVITRFQFRQDVVGWLTERRDRLYLVDVETGTPTLLTSGPVDAALPSWSPDGQRIAYVRKSGADGDRSVNYDVYTIDAHAGASPHQVTIYEGDDNDPEWVPGPPAWSPDGRWIAYVRGGLEKMLYYAQQRLAIVPSAGGEERVLTASLDRSTIQPQWSADGKALYFLLEDDRAVNLARMLITVNGTVVTGGAVDRIVNGREVVSGFDVSATGHVAFIASTLNAPAELFALDNDRTAGSSAPRQLSHENRWLDSVALATTREASVHSRDGTVVDGFVLTPPGFEPGRRYPGILRVHGGPVEQYDDSFSLDWQLMAAHGYVVMAANPRGSSGRGQAYTSAIYADWGNKDSQDVLALVDHAVADGLVDSTRLGVGGWSYGGILTDEIIARTPRFKAATSGAGMANAFAGYGTDMYIREYEAELGRPWEHPELWTRVSYPFLHANRVVTPTLFLCGDLDANVPLINSEQFYQALRSLGRETELVVYPGEYHEFTKPSHLRDRLERYLDWYDRHLGPTATARTASAGGP